MWCVCESLFISLSHSPIMDICQGQNALDGIKEDVTFEKCNNEATSQGSSEISCSEISDDGVKMFVYERWILI